MKLLELKIDDIVRLCRLHKVSKLFAFGSVLKESFNDESDIDLIVDFDQVPIEDYADNYFNLKYELESLFNRPVDLLEEQAIRNPYFKREVEKERQLIYG
jgi:predicted nucleotidyltransferase